MSTFTTAADTDWRAPSSPWCAKLDRAGEHIMTLREEISQFTARAYSIEYEAGPRPGDTVIRLRIAEDIPVRIMTIVGDALHNMRSALDAFAYALAVRHVANTQPAIALSDSQERACAFPIVETRRELEKFWITRNRGSLLGPAEREAIESAEPGVEWEEADNDTRDILGSREQVVRRSPLWSLHSLNNIDKHRRLHTATWQTGIIYWASVLGTDKYLWNPGRAPWTDGAILGTITTTNRSWRVPPEHIFTTIEPRIDEPVVEHSSIPDAMEYIHTHITCWVVPRMIETYRRRLDRQESSTDLKASSPTAVFDAP